MTWVIVLLGDEFGTKSPRYTHTSFTSLIGGVYPIDFALAAIRRELFSQNIELFVVTSEENYSIRSEWAISRGISLKQIIVYPIHASFHQIFSNEIARILDHRTNYEGTMFVNCLDIQSKDFSFSKMFVSDATDDIDGTALRMTSDSTSSICCLALKTIAKSHTESFCDTLTSRETPCLFSAQELSTVVTGEICAKQLPSEVRTVCPARIGLLGNPSDGFHGRTLSMLIDNFAASVKITADHSASTGQRSVHILPHPEHDRTIFCGLDGLHAVSENRGYYGGVRLIQATCKVFSQKCAAAGQLIQWMRSNSFQISYDSSIPRMVGLSGSSAIVTATFEALLLYFGLTIEDLRIPRVEFPNLILDIERLELSITAGLQDRVIQTMGGVVYMDFTGMAGGARTGVYERIDPSLLPNLYIAYDMRAGSDSGAVHSNAKQRWLAGDVFIIENMARVASLASRGKQCLIAADFVRFAQAMNENFDLRRLMYGDAVVGAKNISAIELARSAGLCSKFTGSGGAIVCARADGGGWLAAEQEAELRRTYNTIGFEFQRIQVSTHIPFNH